MDIEAYGEIHELEAEHFWFVGARAALRVLLESVPAVRRRGLRLVEVGCGTGGNLSLFQRYGEITGIDLSLRALARAQAGEDRRLVQADSRRLPFPLGCFDVAALPNLIEHLEDDLACLREARRVCRKGGTLLLMTSALPCLWSHHDRANRHYRRYRRREILNLLRRAGFEPARVSYQNFFTLPGVFLVRRIQRLFIRGSQYDMGRFPPLLNRVLTQLLCFEARLLRWFDLPIGVDLVVLGTAQGEPAEEPDL